MQLIDHVSIAVRDLERARPFYEAIFRALDVSKVYDRAERSASINPSKREAIHVVDAGPPGLRPHYHPGCYAAFLTDAEGNRIEAVCHRGDRE